MMQMSQLALPGLQSQVCKILGLEGRIWELQALDHQGNFAILKRKELCSQKEQVRSRIIV
jgi:hypothetical protein